MSERRSCPGRTVSTTMARTQRSRRRPTRTPSSGTPRSTTCVWTCRSPRVGAGPARACRVVRRGGTETRPAAVGGRYRPGTCPHGAAAVRPASRPGVGGPAYLVGDQRCFQGQLGRLLGAAPSRRAHRSAAHHAFQRDGRHGARRSGWPLRPARCGCRDRGCSWVYGRKVLAAALDAHPEAVAAYVVTPSYFGAVADIVELAKIAHDRNVVLVVDQAWAAHFGFHPDVPDNALNQGADLVISSTHKLGGSLTQSAMLHLGHGPFADQLEPLVNRAFRSMQSTSASSLLMMSLDVARHALAVHGRERIQRSLDAAARAARRPRRTGPVRRPVRAVSPEPSRSRTSIRCGSRSTPAPAESAGTPRGSCCSMSIGYTPRWPPTRRSSR